ncbi:MAG: TRAP-type C4-dicarboxylate transport system permease small subunit [Gammaproteobacteria bacterium]|jgi:TRAP-type C4-dicarboxylate transport system permease small subunit
MKSLIHKLTRIEDIILVSMLVSMILLASSQIILRNLFDAGIVWADPLLRVMVLWIGLIGAMVASRDNRHIRIDLLGRSLNKNTHLSIQVFVGQFCAWVCFIIAGYGAKWVWSDYIDGLPGFSIFPAWLLEVIIPFAFAVIGIRYFMLSICWASLLRRRLRQLGRR